MDPRTDHLGEDPEEWVTVWTASLLGSGWDVYGLLSPTWVFSDGFESGGLSNWSHTAP